MTYTCPTCGTHDSTAYSTCEHPGCPDGRDPRDTKTDCAHLWTYTGVRFRDGSYSLPGSGAKARYYGQHYLCQKCGLTRIDRLGITANTYQDILYNASPATPKEFPVEAEKGS